MDIGRKSLKTILVADDQVVVAEKVDLLQRSVYRLEKTAKKYPR